MIISELKPEPTYKVQFKNSFFKSIPKSAGCYALTTFEGIILYIGLSDDLFGRFQQHLANPEKTEPTPIGKAIWFYYEIFDSKNLPKLERTWLNQYSNMHGVRPVLNTIDSPIS